MATATKQDVLLLASDGADETQMLIEHQPTRNGVFERTLATLVSFLILTVKVAELTEAPFAFVLGHVGAEFEALVVSVFDGYTVDGLVVLGVEDLFHDVVDVCGVAGFFALESEEGPDGEAAMFVYDKGEISEPGEEEEDGGGDADEDEGDEEEFGKQVFLLQGEEESGPGYAIPKGAEDEEEDGNAALWDNEAHGVVVDKALDFAVLRFGDAVDRFRLVGQKISEGKDLVAVLADAESFFQVDVAGGDFGVAGLAVDFHDCWVEVINVAMIRFVVIGNTIELKSPSRCLTVT